MMAVAKEVKKALNENEYCDEPYRDDEDDFYMTDEREDYEDEQSRQILRDMVDEYTIERDNKLNKTNWKVYHITYLDIEQHPEETIKNFIEFIS